MLRPARRAVIVWALAAAAGSAGCAVPDFEIAAGPQPLTIVAGERGTLTVNAFPGSCPSPCDRTMGVPLDYRVEDLPAGVSYTVDTSLQSAATPGLVRITFEAPPAATAVDVAHHVRIEATLDGRGVGTKSVVLLIVSPLPSAPLAAATIGAGHEHSLAALEGGGLAGWGFNGDGQLGLGNTIGGVHPAVAPHLPEFVALAGGTRHSLALSSSGTVWAWGQNSMGQLGRGTDGGLDAAEPVPEEVIGLTSVVAVAAGDNHSLALTSDGAVWAWGSNSGGALGTPTGSLRTVPIRVGGLPSIRAIAAGWGYSLAAAADGSVWIWGDDALGVAEPGTTTVPVQVAGLSGIHALASRDGSALALDGIGRVWAWGDNFSGQLGDGTTVASPLPARVPGVEGAVAVAINRYEGVALDAGGRIWRWGFGPGTDRDPAELVPRPFAAPSAATTIAAGHSHVVARLACGQVWTWGQNDEGQLGTTGDFRMQPAIVPEAGGRDCVSAVLRIQVASDVPATTSTIHSTVPLSKLGNAYNGTVATGARVDVTAASTIADGDTGAIATFAGWAGDCTGTAPATSIVVDRSRRCIARYESDATGLQLLRIQRDHGVVTSTPGALFPPSRIDCGPTCEAVFVHGTAVTLSATTPPGFAFTGWSGDCSGTASTAVVVMDQPRSCRANHRAFELRVGVTGSGRVTSDPAGIDCGEACMSTPRVASVTLEAVADEGWQFTGWGGACSGTSPQTAVTMDADRSCTAAFTRIPGQFALTTVVEGDGTLTSTPAGIACPGNCTAFFPAGTTVDLAAQPGTGAFILGWFDDCAGLGEPVRSIVLDRDLVCRVRFTGLPPHPVADFTSTTIVGTTLLGEVVTFNGLASHVLDPVSGTEDPAGIRTLAWDLDGDGQFDDAFGGRGSAGVVQRAYQTVGDVTVRLRVVGGPFDAADVIERTITVLPNPGTLVSLSVTKAGSGQGTIASMPQGLLECGAGCASAGPLQLLGFSVTLVATPDAGSTFMGWSGVGCTAAGTSVTVTLSADVACTATFVPASGPFPLTVIVNGPAASFARVEALQPPGAIDCGVGGGTCNATLASGTPVILRPDTATLENNLFQGWSGCDAVGTLWTCTLSMNGPRIVFATLRP